MKEIPIKTYFKIYFWQAISIILNFISLYIVVPQLSNNPTIYGIYTICIGLNMFLAYADLGFISAAQKYASESFAKNDIDSEVKVTAFSCFILWLFSLCFSVWVLYLSIYPTVLINNLNSNYFSVAQKLLLILILSSQTIIFQRFVQILYSVRMKDYLFQKYNIIGTLIKITSTFYFFREKSYDIVGYFLFNQLISLAVLIYSIFFAKIKFSYPIYTFFLNFKFSKSYFYKTQNLALSTLLVTISWVLYYEIDFLVIGKIWNAEKVAIYSVAFSMLSLFRTIFGAIFNPFSARFNHFVGINDIDGLKKIIGNVIYISFPIIVITILTVFFFSETLILAWVGSKYRNSIIIAQILIGYNLLGFISYPTSILMIALEKNKILIKLSILMPIIYWTFFYILKDYLDLIALAVSKLIVGLIMGGFYINIISKFLKFSVNKLLFQYSILFTCMFFIVFFLSKLVQQLYSAKDKNTYLLAITVSSIGVVILFALIFYGTIVYFFNKNGEKSIIKNSISRLVNYLKLKV